ncbi:MAG: hypothetical protein M3007_08345 [Candidatus Eremiobacteraeota bacterium]|nr:hypothetical protein [Candidatus Eremiobacteraeota bacterium]
MRVRISFQTFCAFLVAPYYHTAYRIRGWGNLPRKRAETLLIANHQHDLDTNAAAIRILLQGPWSQTMYSASSRRVFEPGFMGIRVPWLERWLGTFNASKLFTWLGMLPIENELFARSVSSIAWYVRSKFGDLSNKAVFRADVLERFGPLAGNKTLAWLFRGAAFHLARKTRIGMNAINEPYRSDLLAETRRNMQTDLQRIEETMRSGVTFYLTPEGRYTTDGRVGRFRLALRRLAPLAQIYLIAMSYDVFVGRRLSILFRIVPPFDKADLRASLQAERPVTTSQLLAGWLSRYNGTFTMQDARRRVRAELARLPAQAFVDPELRRRPERLVKSALQSMTRLGVLRRNENDFSVADQRRHPQFPQVKDMLAYQAAFFEESVNALHKLHQTAGTPAHAGPVW